MLKEEHGEVSPISMEELAEIFGRSKATVHECINATEEAWSSFLESKKKQEEIEAKAERELIEEAKERLRKEKAARPVSEGIMKTDEETSERTGALTEEEVYSP